MNDKLIFTSTQNPLIWANEDYEIITFASHEDAKKAEKMFNELMREIWRLGELVLQERAK